VAVDRPGDFVCGQSEPDLLGAIKGPPTQSYRIPGGVATLGGMFNDGVIQEAGRRILEAAPAGSRLILFGSHARGEAGEHSDLDFLVIEPSVEDWGKESVRLRHTLKGLGVFADIIVVSEESVREWREVYGTVIHSALTEGRELAA